MEYYYTPKEYISNGSLTIVDDEAKHLARVLRKQAGAEIFVTDGLGNLFKTSISSVNKAVIECKIIERYNGLNEPEKKIILFQSLLKSPDRFEFAIEKSVELGVHEIYPLITENVINKTANKVERWQAIALAAMKQSQRCVLPVIHQPLEFNTAIENSSSPLKLIADERDEFSHESEKTGIKSLINNSAGIDLFIGPEGGFTKDETSRAMESGFRVFNMGKRKYRSETAAMLGIGLLLNNKL
jgi:16S rRNA (uracil1498-N3)-methyltransferase